jgi:hypothetical protein
MHTGDGALPRASCRAELPRACTALADLDRANNKNAAVTFVDRMESNPQRATRTGRSLASDPG